MIGNTPLIDAVWAKKPAMVKFLLDQGAIIDIQNRVKATVWNFIGNEPNWTAGGTIPEKENWGKLIRTYLEEREKRDKAAVKEQRLMQAVLKNDLAAVKTLIAEGVDVDEKSPVVGSGDDGQTPLLVASFNGYTEIVRELLNAGANPRIGDYLMKANPAHKGAFSRHAEVIKLLVEHGQAELDAQGAYNGYTALHDAVWHRSKETVQVLLDANVALDLRGHNGKTPLEMAISYGYSEIVELIREKMSE
jgi:ankyrin repeat protein